MCTGDCPDFCACSDNVQFFLAKSFACMLSLQVCWQSGSQAGCQGEQHLPQGSWECQLWSSWSHQLQQRRYNATWQTLTLKRHHMWLCTLLSPCLSSSPVATFHWWQQLQEDQLCARDAQTSRQGAGRPDKALTVVSMGPMSGLRGARTSNGLNS